MDLNGCVVTCMRFPLLFEPLKIYHRTPADDLLQAVNSITIARENFFCTHSQDCTCRGIRNGSNHKRATPLRSGFQAIVVLRISTDLVCFIADLHCTTA